MIAVFQIPFLIVAILLVRAVRNGQQYAFAGTYCLILAAVMIAVIT